MASSLLLKKLIQVLVSQRPTGMSVEDAELWVKNNVDPFAAALMTSFGPWFAAEKGPTKKAEKVRIGGLKSDADRQLSAELSLLEGDLESLFIFKRTITTIGAFIVALDHNPKIDKADEQRLSSRVLGEHWWIDSALDDTERKAIPWNDATWWVAMIRDAIAADLVDPGHEGAEAALQALDESGVWERFDELDTIIGINRPSPRLAEVKSNPDITEDDLANLPPAWPVQSLLRRWPAPARSKATESLVPSGELDVVPPDKALRAITEALDWWDEATTVLDAARMGMEIELLHELERMRSARTADLLLADAEWWLSQYPPSTWSSHTRFQNEVVALRQRYEHAVESM